MQLSVGTPCDDSLSIAHWLEKAMGEPSSYKRIGSSLQFSVGKFPPKIMVEIVENPGLHILYPLVI